MYIVKVFLLLFLLSFTSTKTYAVSVNSNLKYFGYLQTQGIPPGTVNDLEEISKLNNANVVQIYADLSPLIMNESLNTVNAKNMKALLAVQWVFVEDIQTINGKNQATLFSNWEQRWNTLKTIIQTRTQDILAFYFDEPNYIGINENDFRAITQKIKQDFPQMKILAIEAYENLSEPKINRTYIEFVTDYGFDFYYTVYGRAWSDYLVYYSQLKELAYNKNLWVVADGYMNVNDTVSKTNIITAFDTYFALANNDPQYVGMLNFLYSEANTAELRYSLKNIFDTTHPAYIKQLKDSHIDVGSSIINSQISQPTNQPSCPEDINNDSFIDLTDYSLLGLNFLKSSSVYPRADINKDGIVDISDYALLAVKFLKRC